MPRTAPARFVRLGAPLGLTALALAGGLALLPAWAGSIAGSSAAGGSSASSAASQSSEASSDSSSRATRTAEGPYQVIDVAVLPERPGLVRLRLQAEGRAGRDGEVMLFVPQSTVARGGVEAGQTIHARQRPYGVEFAHAGKRGAFFLVLDDEWARELPSTPVTL